MCPVKAMPGNISGCHSWGWLGGGGGERDAIGTQQVEARDTTASYSAHEGHLQKEPSGPNVSAAEAEKPCSIAIAFS